MILKEWPYVEGILWGPVMQFPLVTRARCSRGVPCENYVPSCCSCATIAMHMLVGRTGSRPSCLWGLAATTVGTMICRLSPNMAVYEVQMWLLCAQWWNGLASAGLATTGVDERMSATGLWCGWLWGLDSIFVCMLVCRGLPPEWHASLEELQGCLGPPARCWGARPERYPGAAVVCTGQYDVSLGRSLRGVLGKLLVGYWRLPELVPASAGPARWKERKTKQEKIIPTSASILGESSEILAPLHMLPVIQYICFAFDQDAFQIASVLELRVCTWVLWRWRLSFPQNFCSSGSKPLWSSTPDIIGAPLSSTRAGPLGWESWHGSQSLHSSRDLPQLQYPWHLWNIPATPTACSQTRLYLCPSYLSQRGFFFISSVVENVFH